jgi:hypothetical protein
MPPRELNMNSKSRNAETGSAAMAVLVSLLRALLEKSVLTSSEVRALLSKAAYDLHPHDYAAPAEGAAGIILNEILPQFPEDGGD